MVDEEEGEMNYMISEKRGINGDNLFYVIHDEILPSHFDTEEC